MIHSESSLAATCAAFHLSPDGIFFLNRDKEVISWNLAMESCTGLLAQEVCSRTINTLFKEFDSPHFLGAIKNVLNGSNDIDKVLIDNFGLNREKSFELDFVPITLSEQSLGAVMVIMRCTNKTHKKTNVNDLSSRIKTSDKNENAKFERLAEGMPGVIYEFEEVGPRPKSFRYMSQGCQTMFGLTPDEVIHNSQLLYDRIHEDDWESYKKSVEYSSHSGRIWQWKGRFVINGKERWIEGKSSPTTLTDGTVVRYGLLMDITDQKRIEDRVKVSEERLKIALNGAELGLWEWSVEYGKYLHNDSWASKLGYSKEEFNELFQDRKTLVHPDDLNQYLKLTQEMADDKVDFVEVTYRMKTKNNEWVWVKDIGKALERSRNRKLNKAAGTLLDIDQEKRTESIIQQNEQLFTQLFENIPMGVVLLNEEHKVIQMNKGFEDLFGFQKQEIINQKLNHIIVPDHNLKEAIDINELTSKGTVGVLESQRKAKNGDLIPVIIYGVPVSFNEKTIGIYGIYVNISDRMNAENELKVRNEELDNFVYKVSHDLRAPLSSILGVIHLANLEQGDENLREYMDIIEDRVSQLDHFISDVLSHSKNLKMSVQVEPVDFKEVVNNCFAELNYLPHSSKIIRKMAISSTPFESDLWRINEMFRNIISNAIKYADPEKKASFISIDVAINQEFAKINIEDNGIGISEEALPKIFDMFYRATTTSEGSGIGLYIVKNATEKLGGKVYLDSKLGEGTKFEIILPNRKSDNNPN